MEENQLQNPKYLLSYLYFSTYTLVLFSLPHTKDTRKNVKTLPAPPVPQKVARKVSAQLEDPYHWMRLRDDPDFVNYLHQENSHADAFIWLIQSIFNVLFIKNDCLLLILSSWDLGTYVS